MPRQEWQASRISQLLENTVCPTHYKSLNLLQLTHDVDCRFALNYKAIPYTTVWVEYPDLAKTLQDAGFTAHNPPNPFPYTIPAIIDPSQSPPKKMLEALDISRFLDEAHPARPLYRGSPESIAAQLEFVKSYSDSWWFSLWSLVVPAMIHKFNEPSEVYYRRTREEQIGTTLESLADPSHIQTLWGQIKKELGHIAKWLDEADVAGKHVLYAEEGGELEPTYAGLVMCSGFIWLARLGPDGAWERVRALDGGRWAKLWIACEPYMLE